GCFEIGLTDGERNGSDEAQGGGQYTYRVMSADDKLVASVECTLRTLDAEYLVRVERFEGSSVILRCERRIELSNGQASLIIYPWFLDDNLTKVLDAISL